MFQNRIDTVRASGGGSGTVYASDGVYKDVDTVKLKNSIEIPIDSSFYIKKYSNVDYATLGLDGLDGSYAEMAGYSTTSNLGTSLTVQPSKVNITHLANNTASLEDIITIMDNL